MDLVQVNTWIIIALNFLHWDYKNTSWDWIALFLTLWTTCILTLSWFIVWTTYSAIHLIWKVGWCGWFRYALFKEGCYLIAFGANVASWLWNDIFVSHQSTTTKKQIIKILFIAGFAYPIVNDTYSWCMNSKNASGPVNILQSRNWFDLAKFIHEMICTKYTIVQALMWLLIQIQDSLWCYQNRNNEILKPNGVTLHTNLEWLPQKGIAY